MYELLVRQAHKHQQIGRFLITGGIAFVVNISVLYVVTSVLHVYYLASIFVAFSASFSVSFLMQKFWTFKEHSRDFLRAQFYQYLTLQLVNLALNACLMYLFVEYVHLWYIFSQTIILLGLSIISFLVNRNYIFKPQGVTS